MPGMFGGGEASGHALSLWLLAFASFLFLSLALVKRVAEAMQSSGLVAGRGYGPGDLVILQLFGVCASFAASLVLALYVQSEAGSGRPACCGVSCRWCCCGIAACGCRRRAAPWITTRSCMRCATG